MPGQRSADATATLAGLTPQELRVAALVGSGATNKAVARELGVSIRTIEFHVGNLLRKLAVDSRAGLANLVGRGLLDVARGLPTQSSSLIGREAEAQTFAAARRAARLVTIVGPGGVGKSRLALAGVAEAAADDGTAATFVDLAAIERSIDVVHVLTVALAIRANGFGQLADVIQALRHRRLLVLLDNCEHVLDGVAPFVEGVLASCPGVAMVATSRERLGVTGEQCVHLGPLDPAAGLRLFVERATSAGPFAPDEEQLDSIERICRSLDGLPLAIELVAARATAVGLGDVERAIDDGLVLAAGGRSTRGRHDSLRAAIDWSYDMLSEPQQRAFRATAVAAGGLDLDSLMVLSGMDTPAPIGALVDKSLLVRHDIDGRARLRMLDTVRRRGRELLVELGEEREVLERHLARMRFVARRANVQLRGADEIEGHRALLDDWSDLRAAFDFACSAGLVADAADLLGNLLFWGVTRMRTELAAWADQLLAVADDDDCWARAVALAAGAYFANFAGDHVTSLALYRRAEADEERSGEVHEPLVSLVGPFCVPFESCVIEARATQRRGEELDDPFWQAEGAMQEAVALCLVVRLELLPGRRDEHIARIRDAVTMSEALSNPNGIGYGCMTLGTALAATEPRQAEELLRRAVAIAEPLGLELLLGQARAELARVLAEAGRWTDSLVVVADSLRTHLRAGTRSELDYILSIAVSGLTNVGERSSAAGVLACITAVDAPLVAALVPDSVVADLAAPATSSSAQSPATGDIVDVALEVLGVIDRRLGRADAPL